MSDLWAVSARADILDTEELRELADDFAEVEDGEIAVVFDTGSEDGAIISAPSWCALANDLESLAGRIRYRYVDDLEE